MYHKWFDNMVYVHVVHVVVVVVVVAANCLVLMITCKTGQLCCFGLIYLLNDLLCIIVRISCVH